MNRKLSFFATAIALVAASVLCAQTPPQTVRVSASPSPLPTTATLLSLPAGGYPLYDVYIVVNYPQGQSPISNAVAIKNWAYPAVISFRSVNGAVSYSCLISASGGGPPVSQLPAADVGNNQCYIGTLGGLTPYTPPPPLPAVYTVASGAGNLPAATITGAIYDHGGAVYNVKAFGATGNGETDDTAAVDAAVAAACASGGVVYFPPGNYAMLAGGSLEVCPTNGPSVSLIGAGQGVSTLSFGIGSGGLIVGYSVPAYTAAIRDMTISAANPTGVALTLGNGSAGAEGAIVENVAISSPGVALAFGANTFLTSMYSCHIDGNVDIETPATSGENISFYGDVFSHYSSSAAELTIEPASGTLQTNFFGDSFDGTQVDVVNAQAAFFGGHWEDTATSSSPYFLTAGNGTSSAEVTISGGTMNNDGHYAAGAFFHVEAQSLLSVIGGFQPCNDIAFFNVINADAGSSAYLAGMQVPNCGGYPSHPIAITGSGVIGQGQGTGDGIEFSLPGNATFASGAGAPSGSCQTGSLYVNTTGSSGSTLYACVSSAWSDVK